MAGKGANSFVCQLGEAQIAALRELLAARDWSFDELQYGYWRAAFEKLRIAAYLSGKVVINGSGFEDFITYVLEPELLTDLPFTRQQTGLAPLAVPGRDDAGTSDEPHGGTDESGKGDFFGPLVIAAVYTDPVTAPELRKAGVCDSKLVKSSSRIKELAAAIRRAVRGRFALVTLMPPAYNSLYARIGNLNRLLAWGHARAIEDLLTIQNDCPRILSDKFGNEMLIRRALMTRGRGVRLDQHVRAESDVAVAAASILAREQFLLGMEKLTAQVGCELPRGAGPGVVECARRLKEEKGLDVFSTCAKLHFRTYKELAGLPVEEKKEYFYHG